MDYFQNLRDLLMGNFKPIYELKVDMKETALCRVVKTVGKNIPVILLAPHVNERICQRVNPIIDLGIDIDIDGFMNKVENAVKNKFNTYLTNSGYKKLKYPKIQNVTKIVYHNLYYLTVEEIIEPTEEGGEPQKVTTIHTLDVGAITQCEKLSFLQRAPQFDTIEDNHNWVVENAPNPELKTAFMLGKLVIGSPVFTIGNVVTNITEGRERSVFTNRDDILKHVDFNKVEITISKETYKQLKKIIKATRK